MFAVRVVGRESQRGVFALHAVGRESQWGVFALHVWAGSHSDECLPFMHGQGVTLRSVCPSCVGRESQ